MKVVILTDELPMQRSREGTPRPISGKGSERPSPASPSRRVALVAQFLNRYGRRRDRRIPEKWLKLRSIGFPMASESLGVSSRDRPEGGRREQDVDHYLPAQGRCRDSCGL